MTSTSERVWTVPELAKHVGSSANTIYRLIYTGELKAFPMLPGAVTRKNWRIRESAWVDYMDKNETQGTPTLN